jgi:signal recognition particle subunit SEC65
LIQKIVEKFDRLNPITQNQLINNPSPKKFNKIIEKLQTQEISANKNNPNEPKNINYLLYYISNPKGCVKFILYYLKSRLAK